MQRFFFSLTVVLVFCFAARSVAQETPPPQPIRATPEILALLQKSEQALQEIAAPEEKAMMLFRILTFELRLEEKTPARKTIQAIMNLIPGLEKESMKLQLLEAVAVAQADLGDRTECIETLRKISKVSTRAEFQLNIAEKILNDDEENKAPNPFDVTGLLQQASLDAAEARDAGLEALSLALLGREWAKKNKAAEAKAAFLQARKKAGELEEIEERNILALIIRGQIQSGTIPFPETLALIETIPTEELKQVFLALAATTLMQEGKISEAQKILPLLQSADMKDKVLVELGKASAPAASVEQLLQLAGQIGSPEDQEVFFQEVVAALLEKNREPIALELAKHSKHASEIELYVNISNIEQWIGKKQFDKVEQFIKATNDDRLKQTVSRHLLLARLKEGDVESMAAQAEATQSAEEKSEIARWNEEAKKIAEIVDPDDRMAARFELLQNQFRLFDLRGAVGTIDTMLRDADQNDDPAKVVSNRLILSRIQTELSEKGGARDNLRKLVQFLDGIKDITTLQGLAPETDSGPVNGEDGDNGAPQPVLALPKPVDEEAIKDGLFEVYASIADAQVKADDFQEAEKTFRKVVDLVATEPDGEKRIEKYLILAQLRAAFEKPGPSVSP